LFYDFFEDYTQQSDTTAGLPTHPKYKTKFPLNQLPKSVVVAFSRRYFWVLFLVTPYKNKNISYMSKGAKVFFKEEQLFYLLDL
jgi:hypothetical protein